MPARKNYSLAALLLMSLQGHAATTASLTVIGKVTPPACSITLAGGGVVDFLTLSMAQLQTYEKRNGLAFVVPPKSVLLTVQCLAPTPIALNLIDNMASSKPPIDSNDIYYYGLGLTATKQIGAYSVNFSGLHVETTGLPTTPPGYLFRSVNDNSGGWTVASTVSARTLFTPTTSLGFRYTGSETSPAALKTVSGALLITPLLLISTANGSLVTYDLAGSATISLLYI